MAKDAKGHGSEPRHMAGVNSVGKWQTRLGFYSHEAGKVGQETAKPILQSHDSATAALLHLNDAIVSGASKDSGMRAQTFHLIPPGGKQMPFHEAYRQVFKEEPRMTRGGHTFYPRLKGAKVSR